MSTSRIVPWALVALLACRGDEPRPPDEETDTADDTGDAAPDEPPIYGVRLLVSFGWDESETSLAPVTLVGGEVKPRAIVQIFEAGVQDPVCNVVVDLHQTGTAVDDARWLAVEARSTFLGSDLGCASLRASPLGDDVAGFFDDLCWRMSVGGDLSDEVEIGESSLAYTTGASFDVPGLIRATDMAYAWAYRVHEDFAVVDGDPETPDVVDLVTVPIEELRGDFTVVDGYYRVHSYIHFVDDREPCAD